LPALAVHSLSPLAALPHLLFSAANQHAKTKKQTNQSDGWCRRTNCVPCLSWSRKELLGLGVTIYTADGWPDPLGPSLVRVK